MGDYYILDGKEPKETDLITWAKSMEHTIHVGNDHIGDVHVSTVFLGLDHGRGGKNPILFETMIFGGIHDQYQERYSTWDEAAEGHRIAVELVNS